MSLRPLYGHDTLRRRLADAVGSGRLPQTLLLEGPKGIGKQRLALWLAQDLLCETTPAGQPCGTCHACRLVNTLSHPDLHWFVPLEASKRQADADKQVELVEEALAEEMTARREQPFYSPPTGMAAHSIAAMRLLLRRISFAPAMGRRKVFIVGDSERLIPQRSSPEAANALLKALEEPPTNAYFILTVTDPGALLPTILSRVVRIRVPRLPDTVLTSFAQNEMPGLKNPDRIVPMAEGSIGRLLALEGGPERDTAVGWEPNYTMALRQAPFQARGGFTDMLDGLLDRLRREARAAEDPGRLVDAIALVMEAREQAQGNVNPQLLAAVLADDLAVR